MPALGLLAALHPARAAADPLTVCAFSFNSPYEVQAIAAALPPADFRVLDLSPHLSSPTASTEDDTSWLANVCRPALRCDVVVLSAEFGGRFFGASGMSLGLQEMEELSCRRSCDGLFHDPREVFLLACNTLATKDEDTRTPEAYLQVLLDHGFDRTSAERVVAMRYGPLGPSFREAIRRIFTGVPRLYGFSSVAPAGQYTAAMLDRYFRTKGDYRRYLDQAGDDPAPNRELLAAFAGTGLVQVTGMSPPEAVAAHRGEVCRLYDDGTSVADRLRVVRSLLERSDFLTFLPSIEVFIGRHPADQLTADARAVFVEIQRSEPARSEILRLVHEVGVSALQMELAHLARHLDWISAPEFRRLALDSASRLLGGFLTSESVDIACEITKHMFIGDAFRSADLGAALFRKAEGIRLVDCLAPEDPAVTTRLVPPLGDPDLSTRLWAAYALSRRVPLPDPVLIAVAGHLGDPSGDLHDRLRSIFLTQRPTSEDVRRAVAAHDPGLAAQMEATGARRGVWFR